MDIAEPNIEPVTAAFRMEVEKVLGPCIVGDFVVLAEVTPSSGRTILSNVDNHVPTWREIGMLTRRLHSIAANPSDEELGRE